MLTPCLDSFDGSAGALMSSRPKGSFYQLERCDVCKEGFVADGLGCKPVAQPPVFKAPEKKLPSEMA